MERKKEKSSVVTEPAPAVPEVPPPAVSSETVITDEFDPFPRTPDRAGPLPMDQPPPETPSPAPTGNEPLCNIIH